MGLNTGVIAAAIVAESGLMGIKTSYTLNRWRGNRSPKPRLFRDPAFYTAGIFFCIAAFAGGYWGGIGLLEIQFLDFFISIWYIAMIDGRDREIPDLMTVTFLAGQLLYNGISLPPGRIVVNVITGAVLTCMLSGISLILKGKMGMGDAKLLGCIACAAGWLYLSQLVFSAFLCMFLYSVVLLAGRKVNMDSEIPLAPFLAVGMTIHVVWSFI